MKLADATLDLAKQIETVIASTATGGSTTTIIDTTIEIPNEFIGGSYWITSGTNAGKSGLIKNVSGNTITLDATIGAAVVAGDKFSIATKDFPINLLRLAINNILADYPIAMTNETLLVDTTKDEYTLPAGVTDIRRVEIASNDVPPYFYEVAHRWREFSGKLLYYGNYCVGDNGKKIRLIYIGKHGEIADAGVIQDPVSHSYLRAAAMVFVWRNLIQSTHKDNPVAMELFNEAKMLEAQAIASAFRKESSLPARDIRYR